MFIALERHLRTWLHLKPPYWRMRTRLEKAVADGRLHPEWDFEGHWKEIETALGGSGRHWIDHSDLDGLAARVGVEYEEVRKVQELIDLLKAIGDLYSSPKRL